MESHWDRRDKLESCGMSQVRCEQQEWKKGAEQKENNKSVEEKEKTGKKLHFLTGDVYIKMMTERMCCRSTTAHFGRVK